MRDISENQSNRQSRTALYRPLSVFLFALAANTLSAHIAEARTFRNAYIAFEIADSWKCKPEQTEWVCRSEDPVKSREAIIILTAKERGPEDKYEIYQSHMGSPMRLLQKNGTTTMSKVEVPPQEKMIGGDKWLDSLHSNSEVPNYYTRYLATIKDQIAILVTFSAYNQKYAEYSNQFMDTIKSLKVVATKDLTNRPESGPLRGSNETLGSSIGGAMPADLLTGDDGIASRKKKGGDNTIFLAFGLIIAAIAGYVGFRIYKNNKG